MMTCQVEGAYLRVASSQAEEVHPYLVEEAYLMMGASCQAGVACWKEASCQVEGAYLKEAYQAEEVLPS